MDALQAAAYPVVRTICLPIRYLLQINMLDAGKEMQFRGNGARASFHAYIMMAILQRLAPVNILYGSTASLAPYRLSVLLAEYCRGRENRPNHAPRCHECYVCGPGP
jgi:hypothetical protein